MASICQRLFILPKAISRTIQFRTNVKGIALPSSHSLLTDGRVQFSTSHPKSLKEIQTKQEGNITTIEGVYIEDPDKDKVIDLESPHPKICPLCPNKLKMEVKYTDVLILSQFLRADGCMLPRRVTGLCAKAQGRLNKLVHQAQRAGLMPELRPDMKSGRPHTGLRSPYKWKRYNAYFEN